MIIPNCKLKTMNTSSPKKTGPRLIEILKRAAEQVTPEEREAHEAAWRDRDLSMWETIKKQPRPVMTKEQARIGAARIHETLERWRAWEESGVKIPDPPEGLTGYDDG